MSITYYNEAPYWDDFNQDKNYLRVLFRPGYSVQARELTQLQTALQAQISRFGDHFFKDGSKVMGGLATLNNKLAFIKVRTSGVDNANIQTTYSTLTYTGSASTYLQTDPVTGKYLLIGAIIYGTTNGVSARIIDIAPPITGGDSNLVLYVEYLTSGGSNTNAGLIKAFQANEYIITQRTADDVTTYIAFQAQDYESDGKHPNGYGTRLSVDEGVYYINGCFVHTPASSIIVSRYRQNPWARVIYKVSENKVTPVDDSSLNDNALGTPNIGAPGAHRYQIAMDLQVENWNPALYDDTVDNRILVVVIENGTVKKEGRTEYSEIMKTLAQRTYEESGNYVLNPFRLSVREYLNDYTNGGLYTTAQIINSIRGITDATAAEAYAANKLAIGLDPSVAYINGYRVELQSTVHTPIKKARKFDSLTNTFVDAGYGNYVIVNTLRGTPDISTYSTIALKNVSNTQIGTARVRSIEYITGSGDVATYKVYLFDVTISSGQQLGDIYKIANIGGSTFTANLVTTGQIEDAANNSLVYKLPTNVTKTVADLTYSVRQTFTATTGTGSNSFDVNPQVDNQYFTSTSPGDYIVTRADAAAFTNGSYVVIPSSVNITSNSPSSHNRVTLTFASGVLPATATGVKVVSIAQRSIAPKTKTLLTSTITVSSPNTTAGSYDSLNKVDIYQVTAVRMSSSFSVAPTDADPNIIDRYTIDDGQRDNYYDYGTITLRAGVNPPTGQIKVYFQYYDHGVAGDYFSVSSYGANYEKIPAFQSSNGVVDLRDCLDFRPSIDAWNETAMSASNPSITCDLTYYLPRIDKVYMDQYGNVKISEGNASLTPKAPDDVAGTLTLYTLSIPAYTFSPSHVRSKMLDHRRYTMRDIGRIEKRVEKLEYYTALSLLEKETANQQVLDANGADRYKNGFVVDNFTGHGVGAVTHPDYTAAIDKNAGILRPMFWEDSVNLRLNSALSTGYRQTGPLLTLDYYSSAAINQPYASYRQPVNPFAVNSWVGTISLFPSTDEWKETTVAPEVVMDSGSGTFDSIKHAQDQELAIGTLWNEWATNWNGLDSNSGGDVSSAVGGNLSLPPTASITSWDEFLKSRGGISSGEMSGLNPEIQSAYSESRSVELNLVPYIRSRKIYFKAVGLRPNTKFYAFFDGRNIGPFVRQETEIPAWAFSYPGTNSNVDPSQINSTSATYVSDYINYTSHPDTYTSLYSNAKGELYGSFIIPNTSFIKFKSGKRMFRLIDIGNNVKKLASSIAEGMYDARGTFMQKPGQFIAPRPPLPPPPAEDTNIDTGVTLSNTVNNVLHVDIPKPPLVVNPPLNIVTTYDTIQQKVVIDTNQTVVVKDPVPVDVTQIATTTVVCPPAASTAAITPPLTNSVIPENKEVAPAVIAANPNICDDGSLKGWYPTEAFGGEPGGLVWSCPPQPRITPAVHVEASTGAAYGWYPSEAYGGQPGGLVYGPPPTPRIDGNTFSTNNNNPDTSSESLDESQKSIDMTGDAFVPDVTVDTNPTETSPVIVCIHPNELDISRLNQTNSSIEINPEVYPGFPDSPGEEVVFYYGDDEANIGDAYIPYPEIYPEYDTSTLYTQEGIQVSYSAFDTEYTDEVNYILE
jgi:hypothetical protein